MPASIIAFQVHQLSSKAKHQMIFGRIIPLLVSQHICPQWILDTKNVRFYLELLLLGVICEHPQENRACFRSVAELSFPHSFPKSMLNLLQ